MPKYFGTVMTNPRKEFKDCQEHHYFEKELMIKLLSDNSHDPWLAVRFLQELKCRDEN